MERKTIILDGSLFDTMDGFYKQTARLLTDNKPGFTPGKNLNAFNDLLRGGFGAHEYGQGLLLIWKNSAKSRKDLGYRATERYYKAIMRAHPERSQALLPHVRAAARRKGETLFDRIVAVITDPNQDHDVELRLE